MSAEFKQYMVVNVGVSCEAVTELKSGLNATGKFRVTQVTLETGCWRQNNEDIFARKLL